MTKKQIRDPKRELFRGGKTQKMRFVVQVTFHIPLLGEMPIINKYPIITYKPQTQYAEIKDAYYEFETDEIVVNRILRESSALDDVLEDKKEFLNILIQNYGILNYEVSSFNNNLRKRIEEKFSEIKTRHANARNIIEKLGVPLKRNHENSISVNPILRKKIQIEEPQFNKSFEPEPFVTLEVYDQIISLIDDTCKNIERLPSLFADRGENDLRDFILFVLDPNFELGSATGETFNKKGKTDILLRYSSSNVFVAECKFWKGEKSYFNAINQLLGYLTWRDSKASLIIFVNQLKISEVISIIENNTSRHENYISNEERKGEGVMRFKFHLNGDKNKEIWITVMIYHTYWEKSEK